MKVTLFIFLLVLSFWPGIIAQERLRIMPLGNSITFDQVYDDPRGDWEKIAYRYRLYQLLSSSGFYFDFVGSKRAGWTYFDDCENAGWPGIRDNALADIIQTGTAPQPFGKITNGPYLNYYPADVILLEIGTNDVVANDHNTVSDVNRLLNAVDTYEQQSGKSVLVILAKIISIEDYPCGTEPRVEQYNYLLGTMAQNRINNGDKLILIDMECDAGIDYYNDMTDWLHPNANGYNKMADLWFNTLESLNARPDVSNIPNQTLAEGAAFSTINLDSYVSDPDDPDADITWYTNPANPENFTVTISPGRVATITPKNPDWSGTETITFIAADKGRIVTNLRRYDEDMATFTITPVNDPPVIFSQATSLSTLEDTPLDLLITHLNVQDVDNPQSDLSLTVKSGINYTFSGNRIFPLGDFYGNLNVNVVVNDLQSQSTNFQVLVSVTPVNDPPVLTLPVNRKAYENQPYSETFSISDMDAGDVLTITPLILPSWCSYDNQAKRIYGTPGKAHIGNHTVKVRGSDGKINIDSTLIINVLRTNRPPVITSQPLTLADDYEDYSYVIEGSDPDADEISFTALSLPSWAEFNATTRKLYGKPRYFDIGVFPVSLRASDGSSDTTQTFNITVNNTNDPPFFESVPPLQVPAGEQYTYTLAASDVDEDDALQFFAVEIPSWLQFFNKSGLLLGRPGTELIGSYDVTLGVTDGKDSTLQHYLLHVVIPSALSEFTRAEMIITPNPVREILRIYLPDEYSLSSVEIFSMAGIRVLARNPFPDQKTREVILEGLDIVPGFYLCRIMTDKGILQSKIIFR